MQHFYDLIWAHEELSQNEKNHTKMCSCQIQIDLQPKVRPFIQECYRRLAETNPDKFNPKKMDETCLSAYGHMLNVRDHLADHLEEK